MAKKDELYSHLMDMMEVLHQENIAIAQLHIKMHMVDSEDYCNRLEEAWNKVVREVRERW